MLSFQIKRPVNSIDLYKIYQNIARDGSFTLPETDSGTDLGLEFPCYAEIGSRDPNPSPCNVKCSA